MSSRREIYKLPIHEHPLLPSPRIMFGTCGGCNVRGTIYGGYFCNESYCCSWFHKGCAEAPLEINHPSHLEHPLLLMTNDSSSRDGTTCDCCGQELFSPWYTCPTCDFKVNLICGIKPSPPAIQHPVCHDHPLVFLKKREEEEEEEEEEDEEDITCEVCKEPIDGPSYSCLECSNNVYFHLDCVHLSKEVNHPCHSSHILKIMACDSFRDDDDADKSCYFCSVQPKKMLYHCSLCNFTVCLGCTKHPPPLVIEHNKTHVHPLRLFSSKISFTCKVCEMEGYVSNPYICFKCDFVVDGKCIGLPQVININRHEHRVSFAHHHPGHKRRKCGVCRKSVSQYYGAYSCLVCPDYAVHSGCAMEISNGSELEGLPEMSQNIAPFKVVGDNLITHFIHEKHTLTLIKNNYDIFHDSECIRCEACISPVGFGPIYSCEECRFILHEKCASLPMMKKLVFDPTPYTLKYVNVPVCCKICDMLSCGLKYASQGLRISSHYVDVHCGSLSEPFLHDSHLHHLYFVELTDHDDSCDACERHPDYYMLRCDVCNFDLCLYCATLPQKIWHRSDDEHPLTLCYGGKTNAQDWCDVCEKELDPSIWFFTCSDCRITLHVKCVLGDFSRLRPEMFVFAGDKKYKVVLNNRSTRPLCSRCHSRCKVDIILKDNDEDNGYICSKSCL